jgi:hypothetical protein
MKSTVSSSLPLPSGFIPSTVPLHPTKKPKAAAVSIFNPLFNFQSFQ